MILEPDLTAYRLARHAAAYAELTDWGWLRLTGRDRLDLLHRLSTNALKSLVPGAGAYTVLSSPIGRVMAALTVYADEADAHVRTMPGQAQSVFRYLQGMIFWQDQVEVANLSADIAQFALYGPEARSALERLTAAPLSEVAEYGWRRGVLGETRVALHRGGPLEPWAWSVVAPTAAADVVRRALSELPELDTATVDLLRIEAGLPLWGRELSEGVTPLETGLLPAISFNKGCYTGQEVIARQTNYDKVTRNLVGIELAPDVAGLLLGAEGQPTTPGEPRATVRSSGRGGFVGSVAFSPTFDRIIGLAVVPRELVHPGAEVEVIRHAHTLKATVRGLPFIPRNA